MFSLSQQIICLMQDREKNCLFKIHRVAVLKFSTGLFGKKISQPYIKMNKMNWFNSIR